MIGWLLSRAGDPTRRPGACCSGNRLNVLQPPSVESTMLEEVCKLQKMCTPQRASCRHCFLGFRSEVHLPMMSWRRPRLVRLCNSCPNHLRTAWIKRKHISCKRSNNPELIFLFARATSISLLSDRCFVLQEYLRPKLCEAVNFHPSGGSRSVNRSDLNCFGVLIPLFLMAVHALAILSNSVRPEGITDLVFHALGIFC